MRFILNYYTWGKRKLQWLRIFIFSLHSTTRASTITSVTVNPEDHFVTGNAERRKEGGQIGKYVRVHNVTSEMRPVTRVTTLYRHSFRPFWDESSLKLYPALPHPFRPLYVHLSTYFFHKSYAFPDTSFYFEHRTSLTTHLTSPRKSTSLISKVSSTGESVMGPLLLRRIVSPTPSPRRVSPVQSVGTGLRRVTEDPFPIFGLFQDSTFTPRTDTEGPVSPLGPLTSTKRRFAKVVLKWEPFLRKSP